MNKRYQKNVEFVGKETVKDMIIFKDLYTWNYARIIITNM